jgi:hypothetical protein
MQEVFDIRRFGKYFAYDLNRACTRYGLTALIIGLMPILIYLIGSFLSLIFGGDAWDSASLYQSWPIVAFIILVMSFGPRVYGAVTDRKLGTEWITLPASVPEKTLSLLLITCVVLPACMLALLCLGNWLVSLSVPGIDPFLSFDKLLHINHLDIFEDGDGSFFNVGLILWLNWCENILIFTLGALCFKRNKVGKTILCLIGLGILLSTAMMLIFHTTNFDSESFTQLFGDFDAARAQTWINVTLNVIYGVVFVLLIGGIYARIKTIKA